MMIDSPALSETWSVKGLGRSAMAYYDVMGVDGIKALPVADFAAEDCWAYLWTLGELLDVMSYEVPRAWPGFHYAGIAFHWIKISHRLAKEPPLFWIADNKTFPMGLGHTTRKNVEICLLLGRGKFGRQNADVPELIFAPRGPHSTKPLEVYNRIERLQKGPYLEFFARYRRPGWDQVYSPEADRGPGQRRWRADSYPQSQQRSANNAEAP
jgi:N6-adenosine-specific RNA methylase IME4